MMDLCNEFSGFIMSGESFETVSATGSFSGRNVSMKYILKDSDDNTRYYWIFWTLSIVRTVKNSVSENGFVSILRLGLGDSCPVGSLTKS
jgi:hypothetical protein